MKTLRDTLVIARRELLERVRSKWFAVMTLIGPLGMVAMVIVPALLGSSSARGTKVDIVDKTGKLGPALVVALASDEIGWKGTVVDPETPDAVEQEKIRKNQINGYISIPRDGLDEGKIIYRGDNGSSAVVKIDLTKAVASVVIATRALELKLTPQQIQGMGKKIDVEAKLSTGEAESSGTAAFLIAYILAFILYMVITLYGVAVMRSVVQEKTSRVMEFLVAAVKPSSLMAGKIVGVGAAGLLQITVWLAMGAVTLYYRDTILGWFDISSEGAALPPLELAEITIVLVYFVLGFFFYSAMYAAVGAMVSSEQDTQQVQMPVTMLLVIGVLCLQVVSNAPRGSSATIMTNIPLWSPMLMPMRYVLGGATLGEVFISLAILIGSLLLVVRAAAKIYRVGVLMYGKRPGVRELIRWLRY